MTNSIKHLTSTTTTSSGERKDRDTKEVKDTKGSVTKNFNVSRSRVINEYYKTQVINKIFQDIQLEYKSHEKATKTLQSVWLLIENAKNHETKYGENVNWRKIFTDSIQLVKKSKERNNSLCQKIIALENVSIPENLQSAFREETKARFKNIVNKVKNFRYSKGDTSKFARVGKEYQLETLDTQSHRPKPVYAKYFEKWSKSNSYLDFFPWLEENLKNVDEPRKINFYSDTERKRDVLELKNNQIFYHGNPLDTSQAPLPPKGAKQKNPGAYAYAQDTSGAIYVAPHYVGYHHHSSFTAGKPVICAGMIVAKNGKITSIDNASGHYKPNLKNLYMKP